VGPVPWRFSVYDSSTDDMLGCSSPVAPLQPMLRAMAAALLVAGAGKGELWVAQREQIKRWFWCSVFQSGLRESPNTRAAAT